MKKNLVFVFLFLLFACNSAFSQLLTMESLVMPSKILNQEVHFSVSLPKDYYADKLRYPVVYMLHGLGDDETSWLEYGRIEQISVQLTKDDEIVPMIYVMPQGFRCYYSNSHDSAFMYRDMFVKEFVPYIDSMFHTKADRSQRAVTGYSMGGFGAMMLPLKNPEMFAVSVPLSMSVRTDDQYETEDVGGWDQQWGSIFGGMGKTGEDRITDFYKENSPFYVLKPYAAQSGHKLSFYLDNGDKEGTLAKSNEALHILMHQLQIAHEYHVRQGGHNFSYWCSAMPNALRFMSDAFENKPYRGDVSRLANLAPVEGIQLQKLFFNGLENQVLLPENYFQSNRQYPVLYVHGDFQADEIQIVARLVQSQIQHNQLPEIVVAFVPSQDFGLLRKSMDETENQFRIRKGFRFRALLDYRGSALSGSLTEIKEEEFRMLVLSDAKLDRKDVQLFTDKSGDKAFKRTSVFLDAPDQGSSYEGFGELHIALKEKEISHEYRVREGNGGFDWFIQGLPEILKFTAESFHK
jgi:enterochelin esterase-like enzyme